MSALGKNAAFVVFNTVFVQTIFPGRSIIIQQPLKLDRIAQTIILKLQMSAQPVIVIQTELLRVDFAEAFFRLLMAEPFRHLMSVVCFTMLQKLSKREVKAWLCWNLIILLALQFTWNPVLARIQTVQKRHFWQFYRLWTLNFGKFGTWKMLKFTKDQNSETLKLSKITFLDPLNSPKRDFR